jgi:hypothetical protein
MLKAGISHLLDTLRLYPIPWTWRSTWPSPMWRFDNRSVRYVGLFQYLSETVRICDVRQCFGIPCCKTASWSVSCTFRTRIWHLHCSWKYGPQGLWIWLVTRAVRVENHGDETYDAIGRRAGAVGSGGCSGWFGSNGSGVAFAGRNKIARTRSRTRDDR